MQVMRSRLMVHLLSAFLILLWIPVASTWTTSRAAQAAVPATEKSKKQPAVEKAEEKISETTHSITVSGHRLDYKARAGWLPVTLEDNQTTGRIFFVSYQLDGAERAVRPVTFAFNGGPGAASVWLHMGAMGPMRVVLNADGTALPPPAWLEANGDSWLSFTDLVFVDPIGTGYSRTDPDDMKSRKVFYEVKKDIASTAEFIRLYLTRYQRWPSPKLVVGESYGATRAAGLTEYLLDEFGIELNGLILISPVLDFNTVLFRPTNDLPYPMVLPSYAAAARFHGKLAHDLQSKPMEEFLSEVEAFSETSYNSALMRGDALDPVERTELSRRISSYVGLSEELLDRYDLRISSQVFRKELLRNERLLLGRMDCEVTASDPEPATAVAGYDPTLEPMVGVFAGAINAYLREDLQVESDLNYEFLSEEAGNNWNYASSLKGGQGFVEVSRALRNAMTVSRYLGAFVAAGIYDLATPYTATRYSLNHLGLAPEARARLELHLYPAGHMMYTHREVAAALSRDVAAFYHSVTRESAR